MNKIYSPMTKERAQTKPRKKRSRSIIVTIVALLLAAIMFAGFFGMLANALAIETGETACGHEHDDGCFMLPETQQDETGEGESALLVCAHAGCLPGEPCLLDNAEPEAEQPEQPEEPEEPGEAGDPGDIQDPEDTQNPPDTDDPGEPEGAAVMGLFGEDEDGEPEILMIPAGNFIVSEGTTADGVYETLALAVAACNTAGSGIYTITCLDGDTLIDVIVIEAEMNITVKSASSVFVINSDTYSRHFIVKGTLTLENIVLAGGGTGGGVQIVEAGNLTMESGAQIEACRNTNGGAVYVSATGTFIMNDGVITANLADDSGGGVYTEDATYSNITTSSDAVFSNNSAAGAWGYTSLNAPEGLSHIEWKENNSLGGTIETGAHLINNYDINFNPGENLDYYALLFVTYAPGDHGTWSAESETYYNIKLGDPFPDAPDTIGDEGWRFVRWDPALGESVTGSIVFTAQWEAEVYQIYYILDGGINDSMNLNEYSIESFDIVFYDPTWSGYTFSGWTCPQVGWDTPTKDYTITYGTSGDLYLTAHWVPIDYYIVYELDGGTNAYGNPSSYNIESIPQTIDPPTKPAFVFVGWHVSYDGGYIDHDALCVVPDYTIPAGAYGNLTLTAEWNPETSDTYTITYDLDGGTGDGTNPATYTTGSVYEISDPIRPGHTFIGWKVEYDGEFVDPVVVGFADKYTIPSDAYGDLTLIAKWEAIDYTIVYDPGDHGTWTAASETYTGKHYGEATPGYNCEPETDHDAGWVFTGWDPVVAVGVTGSVTYVAQWTEETTAARTYTVNYDANGGTGTQTDPNSPYEEDDPVTVLGRGSMTRSGYTFAGWSLNRDGSGTLYKSGDVFNIEQDTTFYAVWTQNTVAPPPTVTYYTVTYLPGSYGTFAPQITGSLVSGTATPAAPAVTGQAGWVFAGWSPAVSATVTGNATYVAQWTQVLSYTVRFVDHDGRVIGTQTVTYGGGAAAPGDPVREGFEFTGWDTDFSFITGDITVTAQYEPIVTEEPEETPQGSEPDPDPGRQNNQDANPDPENDPETIAGDDVAQSSVISEDQQPTREEVLAAIKDEGIATITIGNLEIPLAAGGMNGYVWALLNLILAIAGLLFGIISVIRSLSNRQNESGGDYQTAEQDQTQSETGKRTKLIWLLAAVITALLGALIFLLTENIRLPMVLTDRWTLINAAVLLLGIVSGALLLRRKNDPEDEQ